MHTIRMHVIRFLYWNDVTYFILLLFVEYNVFWCRRFIRRFYAMCMQDA